MTIVMKAMCDVCGEEATATYALREMRLGSRPLLIGSAPPMKIVDLCHNHDHVIRSFLQQESPDGD